MESKSFPAFHYPSLTPVHRRQRELFTDNGCCSAVNTCHDGDTIEMSSRRRRTAQHWDHLAATNPSLPLLSHNQYDMSLPEPCMSGRSKKHKTLQKAASKFAVVKGRVESQNKKPLIRRFLRKMTKDFSYAADVDDEMLPPDEEEAITGIVDSSDSDSSSKHGEGMPPTMPKILSKLKELTPVDFAKVISERDGLFEEDQYTLSLNDNYTGGCLSSCHTNSGTVLFVARGNNMDKLYSIPVHIQNHSLSVSKAAVKPQSGPIYQVDAVYSQNKVFVVTRTAHECCLYSVCDSVGEHSTPVGSDQSEEGSLEVNLADSCILTPDSSTNVSLSPHIPGEIAITCLHNGLGLVKLWSPDVRPELVLKNLEGRFHVHKNWFHAYFGSHPRNLNVADRTGLALYDIRGSGDCGTDLITLNHSNLHPTERLVVAMRHPQQGFYHIIATDYSVLLVDERFPNHTVIQWSHTLLSHPQYLNVVPDVHVSSGEQLLLVSSQAVPETHAYPLCMNVGHPAPPYGAGTTWRASRVDDFAYQVSRAGTVLSNDLIETGIAQPLVGMCAVGHSSDEGGVSILQLTSTGNLFSQDYKFMTDLPDDKTQSVGPGYKADTSLSRSELRQSTDWLRDYQTYLNTVTPKYTTSDQSWVIQDSFSDKVVSHICCSICSASHGSLATTQSSYQVVNITIDEYSMCYNCRILISQSKDLKDSVLKGKLSPGVHEETAELADHFNELSLDSPDAYGLTTQILFKLWNGEDVMELSRKRDEDVKQSRTQKFEKWKAEKTKKGSPSVDESGDALLDKTMESVDETPEDHVLISPVDDKGDDGRSDDRAIMPAPELPFTSPRRRYSSTSSRSSIQSTSSRSVPGFAMTPPHLREKDFKSPYHDRHASTSTTPSSRHQHDISSSSYPCLDSPVTPPHGKRSEGAFTFSTPGFLSPHLLSRKSSSLVTEKSPPKKKTRRSQVPGF